MLQSELNLYASFKLMSLQEETVPLDPQVSR